MKCVRWLTVSFIFAGLTSNGIAATFEFQGTVETATGPFVALTPLGTAVGLVYVADAAAVAGGFVGPGDIESISFNVGELCFSTESPGNCSVVPNSLLIITSIDAALTYAGGIPTGGFLDIQSFPPTISPFFVDIDFTEGSFLLEVPFTGIASGPMGIVPVPAAVWLFGSALLGLVGLHRNGKQGRTG